jgi:proton-dependent oligopeptide transporter, POT family
MFATEFWERFSYYGFMGIVVLFMVASPEQGGLGYSRTSALLLFGIVTSLIWIMPTAGGWLADRLIGARAAVQLGCGGLALGNYLLAGASHWSSQGATGPTTALFVAGVVAMIVGAGLFKSNASALLGTLFRGGDERRESGFILFYMGINLGALVAPFGAGTLGERFGWEWGFAASGVGMTLGLAVFLWNARRYFPLPARTVVRGVAGQPAAPLLANRNVRLILLMAAFAVIYMTGQMTYGGIMNLYAADRTDRSVFGFTIPATWFLSLNPMFVILLGAPVASIWQSRAHRTTGVLFIEKIATGLFLMGSSFVVMLMAELAGPGLKSPFLLLTFYFLITSAELCVLPAGLVEISRRSPAGANGVLMGVWIFTMGAGSFLAGYLGSLTATISLATVFALLAVAGISAGAVLLAIERPMSVYLGPLARVPD